MGKNEIQLERRPQSMAAAALELVDRNLGPFTGPPGGWGCRVAMGRLEVRKGSPREEFAGSGGL